jgi:aminopeptidase N
MQAVYRTDYAPPRYWIDRVELEFDLDPSHTIVASTLHLRRNSDQPPGPLELDGQQLELLSLAVDGRDLSEDQYTATPEKLIIDGIPDRCVLSTRVAINPLANKSLYGLYQSSGNFCTQCEALGFRRITYFLDRPDVMATYQVTIRADPDQSPVLLSNGNQIGDQRLPDGRRQVVWQDPYPKPSYLFALVAGNLKCHRGEFTTRSGRQVALEIWVEPQNIDRCEHALTSLQKAMKWDEDVFGLEYDLDIYMIVAVNDFNMGAMENKGLNIFNSKYVLASPDTATDGDYVGVEAVVAHEYFHNWTGNRVTCRDWFQLTLKEGLTVFRDQQFTADQTSAAVKRIDDVVALRSRQFAEDSGPMAHPIRPESYISMDNFYTATVYNKGAEIIRMYHTRLGAEGFRRGMDLYFQRHDGCAVTCDDFRAAMADANDVDFDSLDRWYSQAGTPELEVASQWDPTSGQYTLSVQQSYPELPDSIPGTADRQPVPIPLAVGLLDRHGNELPVSLAGETNADVGTRVLLCQSSCQSFTFTGLKEEPVASVLRGFSAPVQLRMQRSEEELAFLMAQDPDSFNRWDAGQTLATRLMLAIVAGRSAASAEDPTVKLFLEAYGKQLSAEGLDGSYRALLLGLPSESMLGQQMNVIDPDAIHHASAFLKSAIATRHQQALRSLYDQVADEAYSNDQTSINRRRLKNTVLSLLSATQSVDTSMLVAKQFDKADNMTDSQAALMLLVRLGGAACERALAEFYQRWRHDALVLDKWFAVQAASDREDTVDQVEKLAKHTEFSLTNPNRVRALLQTFGANQVRFHGSDGGGYRMLADFVLQIDPDNPQLAARLVSQLNGYRRFDQGRQAIMRSELERISSHAGLSKDVGEIVERALKV